MRTYAGKRLLDLTLVLLTSPLWIPLLFGVALMVRIRLGRPVFFRQLRAGLDDRPFELLKFRTMTDERGTDGNLLPDDRRLTSFGRRLRATSVDELEEAFQRKKKRELEQARMAGSGEYQPVQQVVRSGNKVGRNDPCPCGSGKKYKKCCGAGG